MVPVVEELDVLVAEVEERAPLPVEVNPREGKWLPRELAVRLVEVVEVEVHVPEGVHELAGLAAGDPRPLPSRWSSSDLLRILHRQGLPREHASDRFASRPRGPVNRA